MTHMLKNRFRTDRWKKDSMESVDLYNQWFMNCAPKAYRMARNGVIKSVMTAFKGLDFLRSVSVDNLVTNPQYLSVLRACTAPPLAIDRLVGLSGTSRNLIGSLQNGRVPKKYAIEELNENIGRILSVIIRLMDYEIFPWLKDSKNPSMQMLNRSASIVADRISGALADPIIRNSQEARQLKVIDEYLILKGYRKLVSSEIPKIEEMPPFSYTYHHNVPVKFNGRNINMPIDVVVQTSETAEKGFPILIECKSAGDFANTNKRRKEEATKVEQLRNTYGKENIIFILFLCGYFDTSYLGYEASENIDWVWEHRITDFSEFGI